MQKISKTRFKYYEITKVSNVIKEAYEYLKNYRIDGKTKFSDLGFSMSKSNNYIELSNRSSNVFIRLDVLTDHVHTEINFSISVGHSSVIFCRYVNIEQLTKLLQIYRMHEEQEFFNIDILN